MSIDFSMYSLDTLQRDLSQHTRNPLLFRAEQYTQFTNLHLKENWAGLNKRRIDFSGCIFTDCDFTQTGFAGSSFDNCTFQNCTMDDTNFSQCSFVNSTFLCDIKSANFSKSKLINCSFSKAPFSNVNFSEAYLAAVKFEQCEIISFNWEFCDLHAVEFENVTFSKMNFEFAIFGDVHFIGTLLPFQSIPFIFGGPQYVLTTKDDAYFKSEAKGKLSLVEYKEYMLEMLEFYKRTNNIFPTANLLLAYGYANEGYEVIKNGIKQITQLRKYRTLRYLTHLFNTTTAIPTKHKPHLYQELFETLESVSNDANIDNFDKRNYFTHIRSTLSSTENGSYVLSFKTNIDSSDTERVKLLYEALEDFANCIPDASHQIHISHNSDIVADLIIAATPAIIGLIGTVIPALIAKSKAKSESAPIVVNININNSNNLENDLTATFERLREANVLTGITTAVIPPRNTNGDSNAPPEQ